MASIRLENIWKFYGEVCATRDLSLLCRDGEMLALLGPSGCGKTSTLKMIAGIEPVSRGEIYFDERPVTALKPGQRNIAMVFEDYALYPNLNVFENIAFPLRIRNYRKKDVERQVEPVLELLDLEKFRNSGVRQLSGGAQQRVSIGRALVREPELIIFDEPLSHLDGDQKVRLRTEIRRLQQATGLTAILVTHDQTEAIAMADRVAVMNDGELQQLDVPQTLYDRPANLFVANFIGEPPMNLLPAALDNAGRRLSGAGWAFDPGEAVARRIAAATRDNKLILGIRPEHIRIAGNGEDDGGNETGIAGRVAWQEYRGDAHVLAVAIANSETMITVESPAIASIADGAAVNLKIPDSALNLFDAARGTNMLS